MDALVFNTRTTDRGTPRRATRVIRRFWVVIAAPDGNRGHGGACRFNGSVLAILEPRVPTAAVAKPKTDSVDAVSVRPLLRASIRETA